MPDFKLLRDKEPDCSRYLPAFLGNDPTFKAWLDTQSAEHKRGWLTIIDAWKQFYVQTATWGLAEWETFLGIPTDERLSDVVRRSAIIAKLNGTAAVTKEFLERTVNSFTTDKSSRVVDHPDQYSVDIYLPNGGVLSFEEMDKAIRTFMPAHIGWKYIYQTFVSGGLYMGGVIRPARISEVLGKQSGDTAVGGTVPLRLDEAIWTKGTNITSSPSGVKTNSVWNATLTTISPAADSAVGATDGIFTVDTSGNIVAKE